MTIAPDRRVADSVPTSWVDHAPSALRPYLRLARYDRLLESYSYRNVLKRGFAVVRDGAGNLVGKSADIVAGQGYDLEMGDGVTRVMAGEGVVGQPSNANATQPATSVADTATAKPETPAKPKPAKKKNPRPKDDDRQGSLL